MSAWVVCTYSSRRGNIEKVKQFDVRRARRKEVRGGGQCLERLHTSDRKSLREGSHTVHMPHLTRGPVCPSKNDVFLPLAFTLGFFVILSTHL